MYRGIATFTLDYGKCPKWLFERMVRLGREMTRVLVEEYGPDEYIKRIADPVWFQSLGTVLAFDWNASGLTTILTAALKEGIRGQEKDLGVFICGGKGKTSRKVPDEIQSWGGKLRLPPSRVENLEYNSRMAAKVDSALIQDGYQIYHHSFFFSRGGAWTVVQQGMNIQSQSARRYHWHSEKAQDLIEEPHTGIASQAFQKNVLNLTAKQSAENRTISTELAQSGYETLLKDIQLLRKHFTPVSSVAAFKRGEDELRFMHLKGVEFKHHPVERENFSKSKYLEKILARVAFERPETYEKLLSLEGVGPKTIRALALVAEIIYGADTSHEDPARFSFAHGGKDATPYPVDKETYDQTITILERALHRTRIPPKEKDQAFGRLHHHGDL
ncbi:MAG: DUF763 domain-containing protein [Candidatus Wildermuthbacteria bacterium]|nr:DUF763 domain-containing protein [Candidatus Wildermuthbacteria bacterium]